MGKRKVINQAQFKELLLPGTGEQFGRVIKRLGSELMQVKCADGKVRIGRIRGKLRQRIWVKDRDLVLIAPWEFKIDQKCDILWRYTIGQIELLIANGHHAEDL